MILSGEIPANGSRVAGLTGKENANFWNKENHFNYYWYRVISWAIVGLCLVYSIQLFIVHFDVSWCTYIPVQAFNIFHLSYTIFCFLHQTSTTNIFGLQIARFFYLKFKAFARRLARLDASRSKKMNNRSLAKLIYSYNLVHRELIETDDFFKNFLGANCLIYALYSCSSADYVLTIIFFKN